MKTQDGNEVSLNQRDEQLLVENGVMNRTQRHPDDLLKSLMPQGHYTQTPAITFYTENLKKKNYYMTAAVGPNPFAKSNAFTQPVDKTRGAKEYAGNVNFEKEQENFAMHKTQKGTNAFSPSNQKGTNALSPTAQPSTFASIREKVLNLCRKRSADSFAELRSLLKSHDKNRNESLPPFVFKQAMKDFGIDFNESDISAVVKCFDRNNDGTINLNEFVSAIRGEDIEPNRRELIFQAFNKIDKDQVGQVTAEDLYNGYNPDAHPDVVNGRRFKDDLIKEFMSVWDSKSVTYGQFEEYYKDISASIVDTEDFEYFINEMWKLKDNKRVTFNKGTK